MNKNSLTVLIPAHNEAAGIQGAYKLVTDSLRTADIGDYEIILLTNTSSDGSHDGTPDVAARIAEEDSRVKHFHTPFFTGLGFKYREGIYAATKDYVMTVPGHNLTEDNSVLSIMLHLGQADAIFTYTGNTEIRPPEARLVSKIYVTLCNVLFGTDMRYFNGISIVRRDLLSKISLTADDHSCLAEIIVRLIKSGVKYIELPQMLKPSNRTGKAWDAENLFKVLGSLLSLFWRINVSEAELGENRVTNPQKLSLPAPEGLPDLGAILKFSKGSAVQTVHHVLVYVARSAAKHFGLSKSAGVSDGSSMFSAANNLLRIAGAVSLFAGKTILKILTADTVQGPVSPGKARRKKKCGKKESISLTVFMPARRETEILRSTYESAERALNKAGISDFEILMATVASPDGSPDDTYLVAEEIAQEDSRVKSLHSWQFYGLGYKYREAVSAASKKYMMMIPGDGEFEESSLSELMTHIGEADVIIPYIGNPSARPQERQIVSRGFVNICNTLFGLNLRYYNGLCIIPVDLLKAVPMSCDNFAYMAEILVYLLKSGVNYVEVPWNIKPSVVSKAFNMESVFEVLETIIPLFWKINVEGERVNILAESRR